MFHLKPTPLSLEVTQLYIYIYIYIGRGVARRGQSGPSPTASHFKGPREASLNAMPSDLKSLFIFKLNKNLKNIGDTHHSLATQHSFAKRFFTRILHTKQ